MQALAIRKKELPINHSDCACTFYELGKCYFARGKSDKAILCYREAHRIWKGNNENFDAGVACFDLVSTCNKFLPFIGTHLLTYTSLLIRLACTKSSSRIVLQPAVIPNALNCYLQIAN
jgi:tetratricopeptide (TPR) repeat protein